MYIAIKSVSAAKEIDRLINLLHRKVGVFSDAGAEEQSFDIIPAVKGDRQFRNLFRCEIGPRNIIGKAVLTVFAIVHAFIRL